MESEDGLPLLPSRNRRRLDALWLERLRADGWRPHLTEPPSPHEAFLRAAREFNAGRFRRCHLTLQREVWRDEPYPVRLFYQGVTKLAVGLHQAGLRNRRAAVNQFSAAIACLEPFLPGFVGIDTAALVGEAQAWLERLGGPEEPAWDTLDRLPRPQIALP
jgi:hypothetical protein